MAALSSPDSLLPLAVACKAEQVGVQKSHLDLVSVFLLAVLAGAYIAIGAMFCTTAVAGTAPHLGYGVAKMLGGLAFCIGLILVVVGGAELFTGNALLIMAVVGRRVPVRALAVNWIVVYLGNLVGGVATAWLVYQAGQYQCGDGLIGVTAVKIATAKCDLAFWPALIRGIYCNALVCLAVWLTYSCRTTGDKILAILFPITAFVALEFEHCVANMYFIPVGLFIQQATGVPEGTTLTWYAFAVRNLIPVSLGNIIGGSAFVGLTYWLIYLRPGKHPPESAAALAAEATPGDQAAGKE
jgi:formate/nitrite transporter